jgi:uncharacterized SAM-dependent methyltransferase
LTCNDYQYLTARITATEAAIAQYEDAEIALTTGGVQSYTLDSGQSRQTVTRVNLSELRRSIDSLYNRRATLIARRDGCGVVTTRPSW